jgi:hypothetical protein
MKVNLISTQQTRLEKATSTSPPEDPELELFARNKKI